MASLMERFTRAWNAFSKEDDKRPRPDPGVASSVRSGKTYMRTSNERSIIMAAYNRIAVDVAAVDIRHVRLDENGRFKEELKTGLNECLSLSANIDQSGRDFIRDACMSMLDEGYIALVPVLTENNPDFTMGYDIYSLRVGKIVQWYPKDVLVRCYDERDGRSKEILWPKKFVAVIENPFYAVMNEPNSTYRRLVRKLTLLDMLDDHNGSNKLNIIVQLPYTVRSDALKQRAEQRIKAIEEQLANSQYGIAYADSTEKITQLNRSIENNLLNQVQYWTSMLYSQLGVSEAIVSGEAKEEDKLSYYNSTIEPILSALTEGMARTFLTPTARTQGQAIKFFKDPFKLIPVGQIADIADKFTRNEIMTSNEIRQIVGMKPSDDPSADELRNKNLNKSTVQEEEGPIPVFENQNGSYSKEEGTDEV